MSCYQLLRGRAARVTRLDACGNPMPGADSVVVTEGLITVEFTANTSEGEEINVTNFGGKVCVQDTPAPTFLGYTANITMCGVDPNLVNLLTAQPIVYDDGDTPDAIGFDINSDTDLDTAAFALELWLGVPAEACAPGQSNAFGYAVFPFFKGGILGDFTVENNAINFSVSNANTKDGANWGVGPFDVLVDSDGQPSPLFTPLSTRNHLRVIRTTLAPPTAECGAQALGELAASATAGAPGSWSPANSYGPMTLADLQASSITASPATAWTTGQYVVLGDGSEAYWDGSAWDAGRA